MKIAVITAITNNKDTLSDDIPESTAEFVAFLDPVSLASGMTSTRWTVRPCYDRFLEPRRNAKIHKVLPHLYVDCDVSIWVDANIRLRITPEQLVDKWLGEDSVAAFKHSSRNCVYEEARVVKLCNLDSHDLVDAQMRRYREAGHPEFAGLAEVGVLIRRHTPEMMRMNERWWVEICRGSSRDQLSFPYCFPHYRAIEDNVRTSPDFAYLSHNKSAQDDHAESRQEARHPGEQSHRRGRKEIIIKALGRNAGIVAQQDGCQRHSPNSPDDQPAQTQITTRRPILVATMIVGHQDQLAQIALDDCLRHVDHLILAPRHAEEKPLSRLRELAARSPAISVLAPDIADTRLRRLQRRLLHEAIEHFDADWVIPMHANEQLQKLDSGELRKNLASLGGSMHARIQVTDGHINVVEQGQSASTSPSKKTRLLLNARLMRDYLDRYDLDEPLEHVCFRGTRNRSSQPSKAIDVAIVLGTFTRTHSKRRVIVFSGDNPEEACAQIRLLQPLAELQDEWDVDWASEKEAGVSRINVSALQDADLIVIQRLFPKPQTVPILDAIFAAGVPVIYETDDLLINVPSSHPNHEALSKRAAYILNVISRADMVTTSTVPLRDQLACSVPMSKLRVLPNSVDASLFRAPVPNHSGLVKIGIAGTPTHAADFEMLTHVLSRILESHGDRLNILFIGEASPYGSKAHPAVTELEFAASYEAHAERLSKLGLDIALVPLVDNPFNRAKSNIKWLEYSACGVCGIYSDLPPYECIRHEVTGLKVANTEAAWHNALIRLIEQPELRERLARKAQQEVLAHYSTRTLRALYADVYREAAALKPRTARVG